MDDPQPPKYTFFQSALIDLTLQDPRSSSPPPAKKQRHSKPPKIPAPRTVVPTPPPPTIQITVGATLTTQRTYTLPTALLRQHSVYLHTACADSSLRTISLHSTTPVTFQTFVDYMRSSIYSVHKRALDYDFFLSHAQAWVLGQKLEATPFRNAALTALHAALEPVARKLGSTAAKSPVSAEHVRWVCERTEVDSVLRRMVFDAVASRWTQFEALVNGYQSEGTGPVVAEEKSEGTTTWMEVYDAYPDFRQRIAGSLRVGDGFRVHLLRPIGDYLAGKVEVKEDEMADEWERLRVEGKKQGRAEPTARPEVEVNGGETEVMRCLGRRNGVVDSVGGEFVGLPRSASTGVIVDCDGYTVDTDTCKTTEEE